MADKSQQTLKWIMRAGYAARGVIYVTIGVLAFWAAFGTSQAEGTNDALSHLRAQPMGAAMLWAIAAGLFAYMIWRIIAGLVDVDDQGSDLSGLLARLVQVVTGLLHGLIGFSVAALAAGEGGGDGKTLWTQKILTMPGGQVIVGGGAAILAGAGAYYILKGARADYQDHLADAPLLRRIDPVLRYGLIIYGGLLVLVAASFGFAAFHADAAQSGGLGQALQSLRQVAYGRILLAGAGLGLIAFAVYNFAESVWRIVPRLDGSAVRTLRGALRRHG